MNEREDIHSSIHRLLCILVGNICLVGSLFPGGGRGGGVLPSKSLTVQIEWLLYSTLFNRS